MQNPLVSERLELSVLYKEYAEDDNIYQQKIKVGAWPRGQEEPWGRGWRQGQEHTCFTFASCWAWPGRVGCWRSPLLLVKCTDSGIKRPRFKS